MTFNSNSWLVVLALIVPGLVLFFVVTEQSAWKKLSRFAGNGVLRQLSTSYSPILRNTKAILVILVVVLGCLSLARPQAGHTYREEKRRGIDFIIALDVSRSMLAEDIRPNRLERAKLAIHDLLEKTVGDRVGLLAFAGSAFLQCPLTLDYDAFRQTLDSVDTGLLATQGTDVAGAILEAQGSFAEGDNQKIIVMITDGEDLEAEGVLQARKAGESGITIYTVGVGSSEGELIPVTENNGVRDWLRDPQGELVRTKLNETELQQIAVATGGAYVPLGASGQGLNYVYERGLSLVPEEEREAHFRKVPIERYQWPLAFAVGFLLLEMLLGTRRLRNSARLVATSTRLLLTGFLLILALIPNLAQAFTFGGGKSHYNKGEFDKALEVFQEKVENKPESAIHHYNLGATQFRLGEFDEAADSLARALELEKEDQNFQRDVYESRGFVRFQQGETLQEEDPARTVQLWTQGLLDYSSALSLHEKDDERKSELALSRDLLEKKLQDFTYDNGVKQYRDQEYAAATEAFDGALKVAAKDRHDEIFYNQANSRFRLGEQLIQSNPQETIKSWEQALEDYGQAIETREDNKFPEAEKNREIVRKRLEALKQQQQDSDNQNQQDQNQDQNQQNKDQNKQQNSENQDKQQDNQSESDKEDGKEQGKQEPQQQNKGNPKEEEAQGPESSKTEETEPSKEEPAQDIQKIPGQMTQEQAMQLLELLRAYERKLPLGNLERIRRKDSNDGREGRNW